MYVDVNTPLSAIGRHDLLSYLKFNLFPREFIYYFATPAHFRFLYDYVNEKFTRFMKLYPPFCC